MRQILGQRDGHQAVTLLVSQGLAGAEQPYALDGQVHSPSHLRGHGVVIAQGIEGIAATSVLGCGEPEVALVLVWRDGGAIDGLSVGSHPLAYGLQPLYRLGLDESLCSGTHTEHQVAALGDNLGKGVDDARG